MGGEVLHVGFGQGAVEGMRPRGVFRRFFPLWIFNTSFQIYPWRVLGLPWLHPIWRRDPNDKNRTPNPQNNHSLV